MRGDASNDAENRQLKRQLIRTTKSEITKYLSLILMQRKAFNYD
jgi:hypothetical protein